MAIEQLAAAIKAAEMTRAALISDAEDATRKPCPRHTTLDGQRFDCGRPMTAGEMFCTPCRNLVCVDDETKGFVALDVDRHPSEIATADEVRVYVVTEPSRAERQAEVEAAAGGRTSAALRAEAIVNGSRNEAYGHPTPNHAKISRLWTAYLRNFLEVHGIDPALLPDLGPEDAALMMDLMKTARLQYKPFHADSVDDKVGYALCYERMGQAEKGEVQ